VTPVSVDVHYSADAAKLPKAAALSSVRIGVARFTDGRRLRADDIHAASYVAQDSSFHVGVSWAGQTFVAANQVVQALLVDELKQAGLAAEAVDGVVGANDVDSARAASEKSHCDLILGGNIQELRYSVQSGNHRVITLEAALFEGLGGKSLLRVPLTESRRGDDDAKPQQRVDDLFNRNFRPVAHRLIAKLAEQMEKLIDAAAQNQ
jgi:hypothetical protein